MRSIKDYVTSKNYEDMGREELLAACFGLETVLNLKEEQLETANSQCEYIMGLYYDMEEQLVQSQLKVNHLTYQLEEVIHNLGTATPTTTTSDSTKTESNQNTVPDNDPKTRNDNYTDGVRISQSEDLEISNQAHLFAQSVENSQERPITVIHKERTTPDHPQADGVSERSSSTDSEMEDCDSYSSDYEDETIRDSIQAEEAEDVKKENSIKPSEYFTVDFGKVRESKVKLSPKVYQPQKYQNSSQVRKAGSKLPDKKKSASPRQSRKHIGDKNKVRQSDIPKGTKFDQIASSLYQSLQTQNSEEMGKDTDIKSLRKETYDVEVMESALQEFRTQVQSSNDPSQKDSKSSKSEKQALFRDIDLLASEFDLVIAKDKADPHNVSNEENKDPNGKVDEFDVSTVRNLKSALEVQHGEQEVIKRPSTACSSARARRRQLKTDVVTKPLAMTFSFGQKNSDAAAAEDQNLSNTWSGSMVSKQEDEALHDVGVVKEEIVVSPRKPPKPRVRPQSACGNRNQLPVESPRPKPRSRSKDGKAVRSSWSPAAHLNRTASQEDLQIDKTPVQSNTPRAMPQNPLGTKVTQSVTSSLVDSLE